VAIRTVRAQHPVHSTQRNRNNIVLAVGTSLAYWTEDGKRFEGSFLFQEHIKRTWWNDMGYRLEVAEFVKATTIMIKLLQEEAKLTEDEKRMVLNSMELMRAVFSNWEEHHARRDKVKS